MRTSIDLLDDLFRQLKILAANRRVTLKALMQTAIDNESKRVRARAQRRRLRFTILDSKEPGTLNLTNAEIESMLI